MSTNFYETDVAVDQYLLFHYGTPQQICPLMPEARSACGFSTRCVTESLRHMELYRRSRALDLGCAVGRSALELGRYFDEVIGIDFSFRFVIEAQRMQREKAVDIRALREGPDFDEMRLDLPEELTHGNVRFEQGDACALRDDLGVFDLVLMANLIDRLPDPKKCLASICGHVTPGGWLIITSPYTWMEYYTPRDKWLATDGQGTLATMREILSEHFRFHRAFDQQFLIRDHRRKYQWSLAEITLWQRKQTEGAKLDG